MTFKVAENAAGPDNRGFWRSRLIARDGTQVEVNRASSEWKSVSWAVCDDIETKMTPGGSPDWSFLAGEVRSLPRATPNEIYRIWNTPNWIMSL